jgi:hypothetical protein
MTQAKTSPKKTRRRLIVGAIILAVSAFAAVQLQSRNKQSEAIRQAPLMTLTSENFSSFKESFNAASEETRVVALLSPT